MLDDNSHSGRLSASRHHEKVRVFSTKTAMVFELDGLRSRNNEGQKSTISIECAAAIAHQEYDWGGKIIVQLMERELPGLLAALMGWVDSWEVKGHGPNHNKGLRLDPLAKGSCIIKASEGPRVISVPINWEQVYALISLTLKAMQMNSQHLTSDSILSICKNIVRRQNGG